LKAPSFAYVKPRSLPEVLQTLDRHGDAARLLAGGQSLVATLNMRLSSPEVLVDLTGIDSLKGIQIQNNKVKIGALTTHRSIETSADIKRHLPLLAAAAPHIAHVAIRNAGTFGGSLALADPAAEWPACCLALEKRGEWVGLYGPLASLNWLSWTAIWGKPWAGTAAWRLSPAKLAAARPPCCRNSPSTPS